MLKNLKVIILLITLILINTGCSAIMAASGEKEVETHLIKPGDPKEFVITRIGKNPINIINLEDGKEIHIFKLKSNDEPAPARAASYVVLDIFTLCFAEIVTTPIELAKGNTYYLKANYENGKLINFQISDKKFKI